MILLAKLLLLLLLWIPPNFLQTEPHCDAESGVTSAPIYRVIELAPAIREQSSQGIDFEFVQNRISFTLGAGQEVNIASSPDGTGWLKSDDQTQIIADSGKIWEHTFASIDRMRIVPIAPQNITDIFDGPGDHYIDISIRDLLGPVFSSDPYYLIITGCPQAAPPATAAPTNTSFPSPTPTALPTATMTKAPTAQPTATATDTATPTPSITPTATPSETRLSVVLATMTPTATPAVAVGSQWQCCEVLYRMAQDIQPPFVMGFLIGFGAILWWLWRHFWHLQLPGALEIKNMDTGETRTTDLRQFGQAVTIGAHGQISLDDESIPEVAGRIYGVKASDGLHVVWQDLQADSANEQELLAEELTHQSILQFGRYQLTYQNFGEAMATQDTYEGGIWHEI